MIAKLEGFEEFTRADDALIGQCVRAFGQLEYELANLTRTLYLLKAPGKGDEEDKALSELCQSLGRMAGFLEKQFRNELNDTPEHQRLSLELAAILKQTSVLRNAMCHGVWCKAGADTLLCRFWPKAALAKARTSTTEEARPDEYFIDRSEFRELIAYIFRVAKEMRDTRDTVLKVQKRLLVRDES